MRLTETIKIYLTEEEKENVTRMMETYIDTVNELVSLDLSGISISRYTSVNVDSLLPSAIKAQAIRDSKSILNKYKKLCRRVKKIKEKYGREIKDPTVSIMKKPCYYVNNQNFRFIDGLLSFPIFKDGKTQRLIVPTSITKRQAGLFKDRKLGTLRVVWKNKRIVVQITYEMEIPTLKEEGKIMGVDLGIKCPGVSYITNGKVTFHGNGRKNKFLRRTFKEKRKRAQKEKQMKVVKRIGDKEQRIMKDIDHKISREIVNTAKRNNVKTIKLERLENIRSTTRTSRKNNHSLHNWSFYRLSAFIEYKARLEGIEVVYVNPAYTSQICPCCGEKNHEEDRKYRCKCGSQTHRDLVGAINICNSTEYVGDSN